MPYASWSGPLKLGYSQELSFCCKSGTVAVRVLHLLLIWLHAANVVVADDVHKRFAAFYAISVSVSSVSGILSYGFMQMSGVGGMSGWSYIFIWEGVLTILIGIVCGLLIVDFPEKAHRSWKFLQDREVKCILDMLEKDRGDLQEEAFNIRRFLSVALDLKIWAFGLVYL